ncbi:hypothetical protein WJX74_006376 [Apatococcus lobatus]|uniref:GATA-type domain-containing protein n=1 Tax=Apatococcus lobatus TaxID=904363 RepID=A0AAW1RRA0_9CHLO
MATSGATESNISGSIDDVPALWTCPRCRLRAQQHPLLMAPMGPVRHWQDKMFVAQRLNEQGDACNYVQAEIVDAADGRLQVRFLQAFQGACAGVVRDFQRSDPLLWPGTTHLEAWTTSNGNTFEPRILSADVLTPFIVGSFVEELAKSQLLRDLLEIILSDPSAAEWSGDIDRLSLHRVISVAKDDVWQFHCPFCPSLGSLQMPLAFVTLCQSQLEWHLVRKHRQQLLRESHIVYTEPRAKYQLRSADEQTPEPSKLAPELIGVTLIPLQGCKNFACLKGKIAAEDRRLQEERQQQERQLAEAKRRSTQMKWRNRRQPEACHPFLAYLADQCETALLDGQPKAISPWIMTDHLQRQWRQLDTKTPAIVPAFKLASVKALLLSRPEDFRPSVPGERRFKRVPELGLRRTEDSFFVLLKEDAFLRLLHDICKKWPDLCNDALGTAAASANNLPLSFADWANPNEGTETPLPARSASDFSLQCHQPSSPQPEQDDAASTAPRFQPQSEESAQKAQPFCRQCGTKATKIWRSGPLGPKTLCDACGVHHRRCRVPDCTKCTQRGVCGEYALRAQRTINDDSEDEFSLMPDSPAAPEPNSDPVQASPIIREPQEDPASFAVNQPPATLQPVTARASPPLPGAANSKGPATSGSNVQQDAFGPEARARLQQNILAESAARHIQVPRPVQVTSGLSEREQLEELFQQVLAARAAVREKQRSLGQATQDSGQHQAAVTFMQASVEEMSVIIQGLQKLAGALDAQLVQLGYPGGMTHAKVKEAIGKAVREHAHSCVDLSAAEEKARTSQEQITKLHADLDRLQTGLNHVLQQLAQPSTRLQQCGCFEAPEEAGRQYIRCRSRCTSLTTDPPRLLLGWGSASEAES